MQRFHSYRKRQYLYPMQLAAETVLEIKRQIQSVEPDATVILYGSFARGNGSPESDIDLLILVDKPFLSYNDTTRLTYPLYRYASQTGRLISPLVRTKTDWEERFYFTPLYRNIQKEGIEL